MASLSRGLFRLGLVWTFITIKDNWEVYRTFPSVVTQVGLKNLYATMYATQLD